MSESDSGRDEPKRTTNANDLLISVVIPVYNEAATLEEVVRRVQQVPIRKMHLPL